MNKEYIKKLLKIANEVHEIQEKLSKDIPKDTQVSWSDVELNSKINYLIGYIQGLEWWNNENE